jgi:hypothetical protein
MTIGRMQKVSLREVWEHEENSFTPWLQKHIDILNEVLEQEETNLSLSDPEREQDTENFFVDIVAEDDSGNTVIIENQLEKSNHDHLGKLITYLATTEAKAAIWIVSEPRQEHIDAVSWLNRSQLANFYLIKLEAYKIENSPPAPLLTLIVKPGSRIQTDKRSQFWALLLEKMKKKTNLFANISPQAATWISTGAGKYGLSYQFIIRKHNAQVLFSINRAKEETKDIFKKLSDFEAEINLKFAGKLDWQPRPELKSSQIVNDIDISMGGYVDEDKWPELSDSMIDAMIRLEGALKPHIDELNV